MAVAMDHVDRPDPRWDVMRMGVLWLFFLLRAHSFIPNMRKLDSLK